MADMTIKPSTLNDLGEITRLYELARNVQQMKGAVAWPIFNRVMIETDISENRQWKITIDNQVACVWTTTFQDPQIWEERNQDPSVYIHRIATNPMFKGLNLVSEIVEWARDYAAKNKKMFIRMDTVGENKGLIAYYQKCGFDFLGLLTLKNTEGLPAHYINATVSLFQLSLD